MRYFVKALSVIIAAALFTWPATGEEAVAPLPRNVSIEVEFREAGSAKRGIKGLGTYQTMTDSQYTKQSLVVSDG